jgi:GPH family glycoside/pentoside/hexuronide:cation symporter
MAERVKLKEKIGYGFGDAASSMFWKLFGMYLLIFYTDVFGLPAAAVGTMFLITRIWDSVFDPVVGVVADRTQTKWGKFRPFLLWVAVPFGLIGFLTFLAPQFAPTGKMVYAYITYSLMMMIYSLINVPYASLLGVISADPKTRTELSSYRMIFAFIGSIVVLLLIEPFIEIFGKTTSAAPNERFGWQVAIAIFAVCAIILFLLCFLLTKERVKPIKEGSNTFKEDFQDLWRNRPWWILLGAGVATLIFNSIRDGAAVYYFKYYVQSTESLNFGLFDTSLSLTTMFLVLGQAANIVGILLVIPVSNRIGKKQTFLVSMLIAAILSISFYFIGKEQIVVIMSLQFFISMCAGSIFPLLWSMYADIADFSEWKTGRRSTGLVFSSSSMSQKFGWTIGGALTGWLLAYYGFEANAVQTAETQNGIRLMLSIFPAMGAIMSIVFISFYPLTKEKLTEITVSLNNIRHILKKGNEVVTELPPELAENEQIRQAAEFCEEGAFTPEEHSAYEAYWGKIRMENTIKEGAFAQGRRQGQAEGEATGRIEELKNVVAKSYMAKLSVETISNTTGLTQEKVTEILKERGLI